MINTFLIIFSILFVVSFILSALVDKKSYDKPPSIPLVSPFAICLDNFFEEIYINPLGFTVHFGDKDKYYLFQFTTPSNKTIIFKRYYNNNSLDVEIENRVVTFKNNNETSEFIRIVRKHLIFARDVIRTAHNTDTFRNCKGFEF